MKRYIIWLLRGIIIFLITLPVIVPSLEVEKVDNKLKSILVLGQKDLVMNISTAARVEKKIRDVFGGRRTLEIRMYGGEKTEPLLRFQELGELVEAASGIVVIFGDASLWGPAARKFNEKLKTTQAYKNKELFWLPSEQVLGTENSQKYLGINDIFVPGVSFLGDESNVNVEIVGKIAPKESMEAELIIRLGESLLGSQNIELESDEQGIVSKIVNVPVSFVKPGTQVLTAQLSGEHVKDALGFASTVVNVVHSKTTLLHIALGPDWSLRQMRQKIKFWPNLDLVSYYILREITSDASVPSSQMALIEFPSEKLFGEQLQSFHGVIAQNFPFGAYLGATETKNLLDYVKKGGRLVLQTGPVSYSISDSSLSVFFPCKKPPEFDTENVYNWVPSAENTLGDVAFQKAILNIKSRGTAIKCQPISGATVLAKTVPGNYPVIIASQLGKGIVLSLLGGDWHTFPFQIPLLGEGDKIERFNGAQAVDSVFKWMIEFLQRRQDAGVRPPDIAGPRLFDEDTLIEVRNRGVGKSDIPLHLLTGTGETLAKGRTLWLPFLETEVLQFNNALNHGGSEDISFVNLQLEIDTSNPLKRGGIWPIMSGSRLHKEQVFNPLVFKSLNRLGNSYKTEIEYRKRNSREFTPLIEVYPFLLAFALALLALEQYLIHIKWRNMLAPLADEEESGAKPRA